MAFIVRILFSAIGTISLLLFAFPLINGTINIGMIVGIIFSTLLIICSVFAKKLGIVLINIRSKPSGIILTNIIFIVLFMCIILAIVLTFLMISKVGVSPQENNSTVIILGCRVKGSTPSTMLLNRVENAIPYLKENQLANVIVSGGQGKGEDISEAECMKNILLSNGIDSKRIFLEDKSTSTEENLTNSYNIIELYNLNKNVTIITSEFHQYRSYLIGKTLFKNIYSISSRTAITYLPSSWVREWFALCHKIFLN